MKKEGFLEEGFAPLAQFQLQTLCVWISGGILLISIIRGSVHVWAGNLYFLPVFHLLPWFTGYVERKRYLKSTLTTPASQSTEVTPEQSIIRILWGTYVALIVVERTLRLP
jgi:hypothetical protein